MYKYKLIQAIIKDLDNYLEEENVQYTNYGGILERFIDRLYNKHSPNLVKYFTLLGGKKFNPQINEKRTCWYHCILFCTDICSTCSMGI